VRPLHPHTVHRAAETDATPIEHAWSDQHREPTKPPFSQADRAWREVALLLQARHGHDATRVAAQWEQRRKSRTSFALWGDVVERAGGLIGPREAGSRGRGGQQEPTAWTSRAPRRVRIPHLSRSTSVGKRCTHANAAANDIRKRRAATSEASPRASFSRHPEHLGCPGSCQ
jgi:hypothetical protein